MNLYTRIWLKLAPKGWQVVSTNYFNDRAHQLKELRRERVLYRKKPRNHMDDEAGAYDRGFNAGIFAASKEIDSAPTISPDDVRGVGEWEQKEIFGVEETTIEQMQSACCSVCGKYNTTPYSYYFSKYNYCPNCGARMKGAEDGTTYAE